jgi:hypothetical protein
VVDPSSRAPDPPDEYPLCARDGLFLLGHDEYRAFRPRLHAAVFELGLGAAVLLDLVLAGRAVLTSSGHVRSVFGRDGVGDAITAQAAGTLGTTLPAAENGSGGAGSTGGAILEEPTRVGDAAAGPAWPLRDVFDLFAPRLAERTRDHLVQARVLVTQKRLGRTRYVPATPQTVAAAFVPPRMVIQDRVAEPLGLALCGLVQALGLHEALYLSERAQLEPVIEEILEILDGMDPPLQWIPVISDALRAAADDRTVAVWR